MIAHRKGFHISRVQRNDNAALFRCVIIGSNRLTINFYAEESAECGIIIDLSLHNECGIFALYKRTAVTRHKRIADSFPGGNTL